MYIIQPIAGALMPDQMTAPEFNKRTVRLPRTQFLELANLLLSCCVIAVIVVSARNYYSLMSHYPVEAKPRSALVVLESDPEHCRQLIFNNDNGQILGGDRPCDAEIAFGERGAPAPIGAIRRLDAISKSFLGR